MKRAKMNDSFSRLSKCQKLGRHLKGTRSNKSDMLHFKRATTNCIGFIIILQHNNRTDIKTSL